MNNLYNKVAVASIGIALGFALGVNKEARAATFSLTATKFFIEDIYAPNGYTLANGYTYIPPGYFADGVGDTLLNNANDFTVIKTGSSELAEEERRAFYEFNIGSLPLASNKVKSAIFRQNIQSAARTTGANRFRGLILEILGYVGDGRPDISDFGAGVSLGRRNAVDLIEPPRCYPYPYNYCNTEYNGGILSLDVTGFLNERVNNRDAFAGFGIRVYEDSFFTQIGFPNRGVATLSDPSLTIEVEPVPEPTTLFGSALALGVAGWLKRKKSAPQNKAKSQG